MRYSLLRSVLAAAVAALVISAAASARADVYTVTNQDFESASAPTLAQPLFDATYLTIGYATRNSAVDPWEVDTSFPLDVLNMDSNNVLGDSNGPIIFKLTDSLTFNSFVITATPGSFASDPAAVGYFQALNGTTLGTFTFDNTASSTTLDLTSLLPTGTGAIIVPIDSYYDNVSLQASGTLVPEAGTLPLAVTGLLALTGTLVVVRRKR